MSELTQVERVAVGIIRAGNSEDARHMDAQWPTDRNLADELLLRLFGEAALPMAEALVGVIREIVREESS